MNQITGNSVEGNAWRPALLAAVAGLIVFSLLVDPSILDPLHTGWLATGDTAQSYLGWLFFRQEPWTLPLGTAHRLGMEQANSIVYSDSIPLLAIVFKLFRAWLPASFQYDGLWLFGCYALQGYFACRLLMLFTRRGVLLAGGVLLFLLSPIMLLRVQEHLALTAHWVLLAAIYLYYAAPGRKRLLQWLLLLWLAPWIHAYLMVMAYAIWAAYLLRHALLDRRMPWRDLFVAAMLSVAGSLSMMWLAGYFGEMEVATGGFGFYSMNLLSPLLPIGAGPFLLHAPAAATAGQYEGFNYLGLGVLMGLAVAAARTIRVYRQVPAPARSSWRTSPDLAIVLCCIALSLLALSNVVTWGSHHWFTLPLPSPLERALNIFRASGRLFWPVYYLLVLAALRGAAGLSAPLCSRLVVLILALQLADCWPFLQGMHAQSANKVAHDHFPRYDSPFWAEAESRYANIYVIPGVYQGDRSVAYESLAGSHGFAIDSAYYARMPSMQRQQPRQQRHALFLQGKLDPHGLYLIQSSARAAFKSAQRLLPAATGVGDVDGFLVVAPDWFAQGATGYLQPPHRSDFPELPFDRQIAFGKSGQGTAYLLAGWSDPGPDAVWSEGEAAAVVFKLSPSTDDVKVALGVLPYLPPAHPRLGVEVRVNGQLLERWQFVRGQQGPATTLTIPGKLRAADDGNIALTFRFDQPRSPLQSGESADPRLLALQLQTMRLSSP